MKTYKYFTPAEFERCTPSCSIEQMDGPFMEALDAAREKAGIPFVINSAYRTQLYEKSKGRSGFSFHTLGKAVDIACRTSQSRYKIVSALLTAGFRGIGINRTFIHVDSRRNVEPLIFLYNEE